MKSTHATAMREADSRECRDEHPPFGEGNKRCEEALVKTQTQANSGKPKQTKANSSKLKQTRANPSKLKQTQANPSKLRQTQASFGVKVDKYDWFVTNRV